MEIKAGDVVSYMSYGSTRKARVMSLNRKAGLAFLRIMDGPREGRQTWLFLSSLTKED